MVWVGKLITLLEKGGLGHRPWYQFLYGAAVTFVTIGLSAVPVFFLIDYLKDFSPAAYIVVGALFLKPAFCLKQQWQIGRQVSRLLSGPASRRLPAQLTKLSATVDRQGNSLPRPLMASASIRSLAENGNDFLVAPLFYFLFLGVPGAIAYRVVNTLDSMLGHRGRYEYLGKFAARLDDVINFIPARITAILLVLAAFLARMNGKRAWRTTIREHGRTESPNAGWPMAAMAGSLDVRLEKYSAYKIGRGSSPLSAKAVSGSLKLFLTAAFIWVAICLGIVAAINIA